MNGTLGWQGRRLQRCRYRPDEGPWYNREGASSEVIFAFQDINLLCKRHTGPRRRALHLPGCHRRLVCWTGLDLIEYPLNTIFNNRHPDFELMSTAIQVDEGVKGRLQLFGREGESYDDILNRLMDSLEELDVEEIIEARWLKLQKEKEDYIPLEDA